MVRRVRLPLIGLALLGLCVLEDGQPALAGQAPGRQADPDIPISHRDRVYAAEQFSNTVSVIDPADNICSGVIRLGEPSPTNFSPLYRGQVLVHGMGFSPDHRHARRRVASARTPSRSSTRRRTPIEARDVCRALAARSVLHARRSARSGSRCAARTTSPCSTATTYQENARITMPNGPGMQIFSPDGRYGYVCSSFTPETVVIRVADHEIVGRVQQASPFCPNIAATPDGRQVWFTFKDIGKHEGLRRQAAVRRRENARHRADHEPRQLRPQRRRAVRLRHGRRT